MFRHCFTACFEPYFPSSGSEHSTAALCTCGLNFCDSSSSSSSSLDLESESEPSEPRQTLSSVLLPLLYSPSRTDAALAAIALHGILRAAPTLDARAGLANGIAQELLNVLIAVPVAANPILVDHAARALRYSLESSTLAHLTVFAWQSPVQLMFDMMLEENCTQGGVETTYVAPEGGYYKGAEDTGDGARWRSPHDEKIPLFPSSFDNCYEIELLGCIKTALTAIPCFSSTGGCDNASGSFASSSDTFAFDLFSKAVGSLLSVVTESIECMSSQIDIMPLLLEQGAISTHYAMTRCAALFLEIAPLIPSLFHALVGTDVYAYASTTDDKNTNASESRTGKSAGAVTLSKEKAIERLRCVTKLIRQPIRVLNNYSSNLGMSMPYERPYHIDSLAYGQRDNRAPWAVFPDMEPAWRARLQAAVAAVKRGLPRAIAAQLTAVQREATQTLADHEAAVAAYNKRKAKQAVAAQDGDDSDDTDHETAEDGAGTDDDDDSLSGYGLFDDDESLHDDSSENGDSSGFSAEKVIDDYTARMAHEATQEADAPPASPLLHLIFESSGALLASFLPLAELLPRSEYGFFVRDYVIGSEIYTALEVSAPGDPNCFFMRRAAVTRGMLSLVSRLASPRMLSMGTTVMAKALLFVDAVASSGALYPAVRGPLKGDDARALRVWTKDGGPMSKGQVQAVRFFSPPTNDREAREGTQGTEAMLVSLLSYEKLPANAKRKNVSNNSGLTGDAVANAMMPPPHPTELLRCNVIRIVGRSISHDFSPSAVPGLEALPRFVRCGLLNVLANTLPTMPLRLRLAVAALVPVIAAEFLAWDMNIESFTPYQRRWMQQYVGEPLISMYSDEAFKTLVEVQWKVSVMAASGIDVDMFVKPLVEIADMVN